MSWQALFENPFPYAPLPQEELIARFTAPLVSTQIPEGIGIHGTKALKKLRSSYLSWHKKRFGSVAKSADSTFWADRAFSAREGDILKDALLVITFEGDAASFFYHTNAAQKALEPLGYFLEYYHHWNAGVYVAG